MNIPEAIIRLRDARKSHNVDCLFCALKDTRINEAIVFLEAGQKVEPVPVKFAEEFREKLKQATRDFIDNKQAEHVVATIIVRGILACDIIDRLFAENKELKRVLRIELDGVIQLSKLLEVREEIVEEHKKALEQALPKGDKNHGC